MTSIPRAAATVNRLNRECFCIGTDLDALRAWLEADLERLGLTRPVVETHPHLFSALPVFVSRDQIDHMQRVIEAAESVVATAAYRDTVLATAPPIAQPATAQAGVMMSFDFHVGAEGPQLIEINTNAGGALLNAALARAQRACCAEVEALLCGPNETARLEDAIAATFVEEWHLARGADTLERIAIVDSAPPDQYLYPEFLLFQRLFERRGIDTRVVDPTALSCRDGALWQGDARIDLVYNRLTDFYLEMPANAAVREAYLRDLAVVTPNPRAHALYADKGNLTLLTDPDRLRSWHIDGNTIETLRRGIPRTIAVTADNGPALWRDRRQWFFKPAHGFGSRGSYRGDKITRKAFETVVSGDYVAQRVVPPGERIHVDGGAEQVLKIDLRNYTYRGRTLLIAARLYQGQTTNFRTPGGGFAPVFYPREVEDCAGVPATESECG